MQFTVKQFKRIVADSRMVRSVLLIYRKARAILCGKEVYWIPSLHRVVFATNEQQCRKKFLKHRVEKHGTVAYLAYILFNKHL